MAKNNHRNIELDTIFSEQFASAEESFDGKLDNYKTIAAVYARMESCISVLSDLKERKSYIFYGALGQDLGIADEGIIHELDTIWEEEVLCRIPSEELQRKQEEEMKFFSFVKKKTGESYRYYMVSSLTMHNLSRELRPVIHKIFYFQCSKAIRYALCLYIAASSALTESRIVNSRTGEEIPLCKIDSSGMLSSREKEVLKLISKGHSSKEIADILGISIYTVSRHRQNIIESMNVRNSSQACQMAHQMGLI